LKTITDEEFDAFYTMKMRKLSSTQWTPVAVAQKAIDFLVQGPDTRVLDLGSGAGKFCIVAAMHCEAFITGVEQRENLVLLSRKLASSYRLGNVEFIKADMVKIDFSKFDAFYFFNSFEEMVNTKDKIDAHYRSGLDLYDQYRQLLKDRLDLAHIGTRVVTYCGEGGVIPDSYNLVKSINKGKLLFWEKRY